jgi:iron complex outermembrane receptor protein
LPGTSKYKANATARYEFNIEEFLTHFQASLEYQSSQWSDLRTVAGDTLFLMPGDPLLSAQVDPVRSILGKNPSFTVIDFSTGIQNEAWSLEFFVKNAFDTRAQLYRYAECTTQVCGHNPYIVTNTPRTFGIRFGQKF